MKTRCEIKALGKEKFKALYWPCVGASFLIALVAGVASGTVIGAIVLMPVLTIGLNFFYVQVILGTNPDIGTGFSAAFEGFGRKLGGYWWMILHIFLWSLLFYIPGIIKTFAYAMTPYILADCPNVKAKDALTLSRRIMKGKKWKLFVFYLSFIGWYLLSALTFGILPLLYVTPFVSSSTACWYLEAREDALRSGVITLGQLEGTEPVV